MVRFLMEGRTADCIVRDVGNVGSQRMHDRTHVMLAGRGRHLVRIPSTETQFMFVPRPASKVLPSSLQTKLSVAIPKRVMCPRPTPVLNLRGPGPHHTGTPIQPVQRTGAGARR